MVSSILSFYNRLCCEKSFHISFPRDMMIMDITTNRLNAFFECYDLSFFKLASNIICNLFYLFITFMRFDLHQSLVYIPCHCILLGYKVVDELAFFFSSIVWFFTFLPFLLSELSADQESRFFNSSDHWFYKIAFYFPLLDFRGLGLVLKQGGPTLLCSEVVLSLEGCIAFYPIY
jgi:hypothetical protein